MSYRKPIEAAPRLIGFDVPRLETLVDHLRDEAMVAKLDTVPTEAWVALFCDKVGHLKGELDLAEVKIDGNEISFFGSIADGRRLADKVAALIHQVTIELMPDVEGHSPE